MGVPLGHFLSRMVKILRMWFLGISLKDLDGYVMTKVRSVSARLMLLKTKLRINMATNDNLFIYMVSLLVLVR